jgi:hypothetical protein
MSNSCGFQTVGKMSFIKPANFLEDMFTTQILGPYIL